MALVIAGQIVPIATSDPSAVFKGRIYLNDNGLVEAVTAAGAPAPAGFTTAPVVDTGNAFVIPGIIDLHNHLGYNNLPLWTEPTRKTPYLDHNQWPGAPSYKPDISWPAWLLAKGAPAALLAYVQTRALVGGTTSIQGWPQFNQSVQLTLRDVDNEKAGTTNPNLIYTAVITETPEQLTQTSQRMGKGAGFIYHCSEGAPSSSAAREFVDVATAGCLDKTLIAIHCNAVADTEWPQWKQSNAGAVVWSPFSNLWLYGVTTNILAAKKSGISICLGSDWGPSGTKHVLGEIKVAKLVNQKQSLGLTDQDLVAMITSNPGDVLARCWNRPIGRLIPNSFGDVTVLRPKGTTNVWSQIVNATESEVMLVVVGSKARYGDAALMKSAGATATTAITINGTQRSLALAPPTGTTAATQWSDVVAQIDAVRKNPAGTADHIQKLSQNLTATQHPPLQLELDMPIGAADTFAGPPPNPATVVIPPLPTLVHDKAFFNDIHGRGFHNGLLDGLATFYKN
jgi:5-methylthioadenosine/S-adenosylhomocysteine deaminase